MLAGITLHNFLVITFMAAVGIVLLKYAAAKTNVPGLQKFAGAI